LQKIAAKFGKIWENFGKNKNKKVKNFGKKIAAKFKKFGKNCDQKII